MDILPYPSDACQPPIEIEFICETLAYEWEQIDSFKDESRWREWKKCVDEFKESGPLHNDALLASRIQAVVYFGFLKGILSSSFQISHFVQSPGLITISCLSEILPR